jgi:aquaporin NIP
MKKYLAEFLGTFALVFCGTGAIIINEHTGGQIGHIGIAITFGLIVTAMIYSFGDISGAHFNPAVTVGFWAAKRMNKRELVPYITAQLIGAFLATGILKLLFPDNVNLGNTLPFGSVMQSFILEIILTFILVLVIISTSQGSKEVGVMAGMAIGFTVLLEAMFAGPISGASMNPARSIAPAVVSGNVQFLWIYLAAPFIGAVLSAIVFRIQEKL